MWPDLLRGIMGNLSTYGLSPMPTNSGGYVKPVADPQLEADLAQANANLRQYTPPSVAAGAPTIDDMIAIAQQMGNRPKLDRNLPPEPPPQTPADATAVTPAQGAGRYSTDGTGPQQTMLNMLMQHLLAANGAPPSMNMGAGRRTADEWQRIYKYYHPTLTPGQPLPLRMR